MLTDLHHSVLIMMVKVEKVNAFYDRKLEEQENRISLLTENVVSGLREKYQDATGKQLNTAAAGEEKTEDDAFGFSPVTTREKKAPQATSNALTSLDWRELVKRMTRKNSPGSEREEKMKTQTVLDVDELDGDDPDSLVRDKQEVKKIAVADSIQRALVDQYRTAQLLKNFAIMNYTGFIKIAKKHDKALKHRKGRFKATTEASNICNEGKAVEKLAERLEMRYANWFCDGNHREAHAQLLPKKGGTYRKEYSRRSLATVALADRCTFDSSRWTRD